MAALSLIALRLQPTPLPKSLAATALGTIMLLQAITIADQRYESAKRSVDFIQRYIFPGSCLPSVGALSASIARASDMRLLHLEDIGPHYAQTLHEWRRRFLASLPAIRALGYDNDFIRMKISPSSLCSGAHRTIC